MRYVVSLGGNALGKNPIEQKQLLQGVAKSIVHLIKLGHEVIIVHGNGPQVGMINLAFTESVSSPEMPFPECGAMSEGYIGYHIQNAIDNALREEGIKRNVVTLVSQVLVDKNDPLFKNPTKPIGSFYSKEEALRIEKEKGYTMKEDAGRGYRRVVASPLPIDVIEKESIKTLVEKGDIVICAGGGGIPVILENSKIEGVAAVIDKDYASAKVAELVNADILMILTAVDNVYIDFNKPTQKKLTYISLEEMKEYLHTDYFAKGSMYPKVNACIKFLESSKDKVAVISSLEKANLAFELKEGTIIR